MRAPSSVVVVVGDVVDPVQLVDVAARIAAAAGGQVHALTVAARGARHPAEDRLASWRARGVAVEVARIGDARRGTIAAEADRRGCDLLIMGTRFRLGRDPARRIAREGRFPVMLVRDSEPTAARRVVAAVGARAGGLEDRPVVTLASLVAGALDAELHVVHGCRGVPERAICGDEPLRAVDPGGPGDAALRAHLHEWLRRGGVGVSPRRLHLIEDHPENAALDAARELCADVLVVGRSVRPRTLRARWLSIAETVTPRAACSVLVVPRSRVAAEDRLHVVHALEQPGRGLG